MNNTIQISIYVKNDEIREELIALLSTLSFDAFEEKENELSAFIKEELFCPEALAKLLLPYNLEYGCELIEERNWNAVWESNFQPVVVGDFCAIRAEFHPRFTTCRHEIIITPKMSFGTGHHATTYLMISEMSKLNFEDKEVADFGTGTGILAILSEKLNSKSIWATDHDDWSIENSRENIERNNCSRIWVEKLDGFFPTRKFEIILANINKNVILSNVDGLLFGLKERGQILISGLLKEDEKEVVQSFENKGIQHISTVEKNNWICLLLQHKRNL